MSGEAPAVAGRGKPVNWRLIVFTTLFLAVSAAEYMVLLLWPGVALSDKLSVALTIIGAYGLGLGFLSRLGNLDKRARGVIDELLSPNAALCFAGNMTYLGTLLHSLALVVPASRSRAPLALRLLMMLAVLVMAAGLLAYVVFHAVVVVPLTYPAVLVAASVVQAYEATAPDSRLSVTDSARTIAPPVPLREIVLAHRAAATAFIMGLPAAVLAVVGPVFGPFV